MNPLSINPLAMLCGAAIVGAIGFGGGWTVNSWRLNAQIAELRSDWAKETAERKEAENLAVFQRLRNNERAKEQQEIDSQRMKKENADEIAKIHAAYDRAPGLRINKNICAGFAARTEAESASRSNGETASTGLLPEPYNRDIRALMLEADEIVAGCRVAQKFIQSNGMAP